MADNQITPFQLTDQFTMDNFNQRINETNIALQNKADASSVYTKTEADTLLATKLGGIESPDYPGCYYRTVDGVTEWVNPPMILGIEYRTTERYLGKPVYAIAVDFKNLPNATTKEITVSGVSSPDKVVSVFGYTSDRKTIPTFSYGWSSISTISDAIALDASAHPNLGLRINVTTQSNRSSATAVIIVKYTKSTD